MVEVKLLSTVNSHIICVLHVLELFDKIRICYVFKVPPPYIYTVNVKSIENASRHL